MRITVFGIGYVGLSNAIVLAQHNDVIAYDISEEKVKMLNKHISPIDDREIREYLTEKNLKLSATSNKKEAYINKVDYIIIATPTDYKTKRKNFDTSSIESVISDVNIMSPLSTVIIKSTVPIGFTEQMRKEYPDLSIIFSPEFLREGKALYDNLYPSRIVIGGLDKNAKDFAELLLQGVIKKDVPICFLTSTEAEAVKLFSNTFLAMRIAFFNELDTYSELKGLNAKSIIENVSLDPRIGNYYNNPSFGYGGYCLPKDTKQIKRNYAGIPHSIISAIVKSNTIRKKHIVKMIEKRNPKTVGIYKLAMKAGSDNFRASAVINLIKKLLKKNISVIIFEPLTDKKKLFNCQVVNIFDDFIIMSDVILANRMTDELKSISDKVYTRDIFMRD